jgi:hypothetical protein
MATLSKVKVKVQDCIRANFRKKMNNSHHIFMVQGLIIVHPFDQPIVCLYNFTVWFLL